MEFDKTTTLANLGRLKETIETSMRSAISFANNQYNGRFTDELNETFLQMTQDLSYVHNLMIEVERGNSPIEEYPMVERKNLMSGEYFLEELDTPIYCSPSSESFWSM